MNKLGYFIVGIGGPFLLYELLMGGLEEKPALILMNIILIYLAMGLIAALMGEDRIMNIIGYSYQKLLALKSLLASLHNWTSRS